MEAAAVAPESRDWSQLLPDLLQEIAGHLTEIPDRIRFRCVCPQWRSATELISRPPRQLPWLLLPLKLDLKTRLLPNIADFKVKSKRRFLSVAERRIYELPLIDCIQLPLPIDDDIDDPASSHIWMCEDIASCSMLLPASLPPLPKRAEAMRKAKIFSSSSSSWHDLIIAILGGYYDHGLLFCRPGETPWKRIPISYISDPRGFAFHDNRFFALHPHTAVVSVFDVDTVQKTREIPAPVQFGLSDTKYLVETPFGELLLVIHEEKKNTDKVFRLFQLDKTKFVWIKISSIGDNVLFLDRFQAIAFDARSLTSCRGNSIYFLDLNIEGILLFDIEKGRVEETPILEIKDCRTAAFWMVPTIR